MRRISALGSLVALLLTSAALTWSPVQARSRASALESFSLRKGTGTRVTLPKGLTEVSGLAVSVDGQVLAHADERAIVSVLDRPGGTVQRWFSFGKPPMRGDFEGIATVGPRVILMTSLGILHEAREGPAGTAVQFTSKDTGFGSQCELEGLAYDAREQVLLIPCKTPLVPGRRGRVTLFRWSVPRAVPADPPQLSVPLDGVTAHTGTKSFNPSAVDVDPVTGNYLLVAGPQRAVLELTPRGEVLGGAPLSRTLHQQPEGIAFVGDSVLLIADEGARNGRGTLTTYRRAR